MQIIACAGSGKTEVVAQRVADLIAEGVDPAGIIAFTFTERAAEELKARISARVEPTTINAGETATGWLLFDLPSPYGKIVYALTLDGQPLGSSEPETVRRWYLEESPRRAPGGTVRPRRSRSPIQNAADESAFNDTREGFR